MTRARHQPLPISNLSPLLDRLQSWRPYPRAVLLYVDIRNMRAVNRLAEPGGGDQVIHAVTETIRAWAGAAGIACRLWSNEFVAAKSIDQSQGAVEEAMALRAQLTDIVYDSVIGNNHIAVSIGMTVVGREGAHWAEALANAAEACEAAKRRGLNQIVSFATQSNEQQVSRINAANVLNFRELLAANRLEMHAQPVMDIRGAKPRLAKAEFLMRMEQDGRYLPLPAGTIETLEYFGLTAEIDGFAAQAVTGWMLQNTDAVAALDGLTMNLSAKSLADGRFMDRLFNDVRGLHLPTGKLGFEITETAAITHLEIAAEIIAEFRSIGCSFSLDDFGSGLCSFGYLHSLPVDEVKIDGRFTRDLAQSPVSQEIVRAIHQVARATGKRTVAEFVDDARKLAVLQSLGVDYAQGWLFYPALPSDQFLALLRNES